MTVTSILPRLPMTKAVVALLTGNVGNMPVGLSAIPRIPDPNAPAGSTATVMVELPYLIVFPLWSTPLDGPPLTRPDADVEWTYQVSGYAKKGDQLEWMRDKILEVLLSRNVPGGGFLHPLNVDGMRVMDRVLKADVGPDQDTLAVDVRVGIKVTPID